ncbi:unknown [Bifidobacterium pseudocatenulatum CAG:263]|nr:unknown [Bifidobacterium pseudocatenulatum CAG:263]
MFRSIDLRNNLQQRGLAGTVTPDDTEEITLTNFEVDVTQNMLLGIAFDAFRPIQKGHLQASSLFCRQTEHFGDMVDPEHYRALVNVSLFSHCNLSHDLEHLRELGTVLTEHVNAQPQNEN